MTCANILLNEWSFHGYFQENLEKTEWKPRCRLREQVIFSLPSSNLRMWQGVALQRFIFPLKLSPENGNDYSQFQIIFFPRLHKSRMLASHFQWMSSLCLCRFLVSKHPFTDEILSMEKVFHSSGVKYIKHDFFFLKTKLFNLNSYQIMYF